MIINHNLLANNAIRSMNSNSANASKSMTKLSSGLRINSAADDAAGLAISEKMRGQIRGLDQASSNAQDAISLTQTAEGALNETQSILQRMRELSVQASNDTNTSTDRGEIQKEMNQLTSEINRIGNTTEFNTMKLLNGERADTSTVNGVRFSGAGTTTTNAGGTGLNVTLTAANALTNGSHTLDIKSIRETRADQVVAPKAADISTTGTANTTKFAGDAIAVVAGTVDSASTITLTWDSAEGAYAITGTLKNSTTGDLTFGSSEYVHVGQEYNNHGLTFTVDSAGTVADGDTISMTLSGGTTSVATEQVGYTTVGASATHATFAGSGVTLTDSQELSDLAGGQVKITLSGTGMQVQLLNASGVVVENDTIASGTGTYNAHGVSFQITAATDASNVDEITIDINNDTYTLQAKLDSGSTVNIASGYNGTDTTGVGIASGALAGMQLTQGGVMKTGTYTFTSEANTSGEDHSLTMQVGANQGQGFTMNISDMRSQALGISASGTGTSIKNADGSIVSGAAWTTTQAVTNGTDNISAEYSLDVSDAKKATAAIKVLDNAITKVSAERSKLGAYQNRLEHTINNLGTSSENLTAAESRIRDVDMAKEMSTFSKNNILSQAAQAMLAQANQQPQQVLSLLR